MWQHIYEEKFKDDTAITRAVEKSTQSARALLRIINQPDSATSSNQASEEHHREMSNQTSSDANQDHHSGMSNKTPSDAQHAVEPFHQWLMTATPQTKEEKTSTQSLITHRAGIGIDKENWDVINNRWCEWYKALMGDWPVPQPCNKGKWFKTYISGPNMSFLWRTICHWPAIFKIWHPAQCVTWYTD